MVVKAETQLNGVYQTKPVPLARIQVKHTRNSLNRLDTLKLRKSEFYIL